MEIVSEMGGGASSFGKLSISSPVCLQIDKELVLLISLIGLNKFLMHISDVNGSKNAETNRTENRVEPN